MYRVNSIDNSTYKDYISKQKAKMQAIKQKQIFILNLETNKKEYITKDIFIIYKVDKLTNDIKYLKEYNNLKEILKDYKINNINSLYHYIIKDIKELNEEQSLLNNNYIIFKDKELIF